ncbi:MAG: DEAD/DEAH box helicase [Fulvivirga sp.]
MQPSKKKKNTQKEEPKVPYHKKPEKMNMEKWQRALRKQFAANNPFGIENIGSHEVFSDYHVYNPATENSYKVALRSADNSLNFCSCLDFKTNGLGTCKHIEAVLLKINKKATTAKALKKGYTPSYSSLYLKYGAERSVMLRIGTEDGAAFEQLAGEYFDENLCLKEAAFFDIESLLQKARAINTDFRCYDDALSYILTIREKQNRIKILDTKISDNGTSSTYLDGLIKAKLFPYQIEGVRFAAKAGRSLIADDMGLGKTIQAIATAELMKKEFGISRTIIVCPTSLKYQWKAEIEKFTDSKATVIEGHILKRAQLYREDDSFYHILSYNVVANDVETLNITEPDMVILDEAQRIKNWKTKVAQGVKKLESKYAIVLTGTPLENKLEELYSIIQFVDRFKLGALFRFLEKHQSKDEFGKVVGYQDLHKISDLLSDILIRRTKKKVLKQLPERIDKNLFVPMTEKQKEAHNDFHDLAARMANKWKRFGFLSEEDRKRLLLALNGMRMVSDSTFILDQETRHDTKIDELMSILDEVLEDEDQKVVVFSQWERMTRLVAWELDARQIKYENLNGSIPSAKRKALFDNFNNDPESRVFLSTDAGGVGLNLQAASLLINLDIPWNPAVLEQRIARIHRLGQKKKVNIINMVSTGTIEHKMLDVLKFKSSLAEGILDQGEDAIFMGDSKFKTFMKSVGEMVDNTEEAETSSAKSVADKEDMQEENRMAEAERADAKEKKESKQLSFFGDDDVATKTGTSDKKETAETPANELLSAGMDFFGKLATTLADKKATDEFVSSIMEKDKSTGKSYVKIPVADEKTVENAVNLISGFLKAFQK